MLCNFISLQLKFSNSVPKAIPRNDNGRGEEAGDRCIHWCWWWWHTEFEWVGITVLYNRHPFPDCVSWNLAFRIFVMEFGFSYVYTPKSWYLYNPEFCIFWDEADMFQTRQIYLLSRQDSFGFDHVQDMCHLSYVY